MGPIDHLAQAERHVREGEERVVEQRARLERLIRDRDSQRAITNGQTVLRNLERSLELAKEHLEIERRRHGKPPG